MSITKFEENGRTIYSASVADLRAEVEREAAVNKTISKYWRYVAGGNINHEYCRNIAAWLEANSGWREQNDGWNGLDDHNAKAGA